MIHDKAKADSGKGSANIGPAVDDSYTSAAQTGSKKITGQVEQGRLNALNTSAR